jgi:hypothetical protein
MNIFPTKFAIFVTNLLTFIFFSFFTIRSGSWLRGFVTLILLVVVVRIFLLGILGFIFLLGHQGFVGCTCSVNQSKLHKLILILNNIITKGLKRGYFITIPRDSLVA